MNDNKKPSEPLEPERWTKTENEIQKMKRSALLFNIGLLLLAVLYGFMILIISLRINQISDVVLHLSKLTDSMVSFHGTVLRCFEEIARIIC